MAAAHFLARAGVPVTLFERENQLGGIVRQVIPGFRISGEAIDKDAAMLTKLGVDIRLGRTGSLCGGIEGPGLYPHSAGRGRVEARQAGYSRQRPACYRLDAGHQGGQGDRQRPCGRHRRRQYGHGRGPSGVACRCCLLYPGLSPDPEVHARRREELELAMADGVRFLELVSPWPRRTENCAAAR